MHDDSTADSLPDDVIEEAERLTRRARAAVDDAEAAAYLDRRADLLADHDYVARVRDDDTGDVLVLHPAEWVEDGAVQPNRIDDLDRGIERRLSGPGDAEDWDAIEAHNRDIARAVATAHGDVHGATAHAFADYMSNHCAKRIESATNADVETFRTEYFPRNAWPSDRQRARLEQSLAFVFEVADADHDPT